MKTCIIRPDIIGDGGAIFIGNNIVFDRNPMPYRWGKCDNFMVFYNGKWESAESIDFEFPE